MNTTSIVHPGVEIRSQPYYYLHSVVVICVHKWRKRCHDRTLMTHSLTSHFTPWVFFFPTDPRATMRLYNRGRMLVDGGDHSWLKSILSNELHLNKLTIVSQLVIIALSHPSNHREKSSPHPQLAPSFIGYLQVTLDNS